MDILSEIAANGQALLPIFGRLDICTSLCFLLKRKILLFFDKNILIFSFSCGMIEATQAKRSDPLCGQRIIPSVCPSFLPGFFWCCWRQGFFWPPRWWAGLSKAPEGGQYTPYASAPPFTAAPDRLLAGISLGEVFTAGNIALLRRCSWCCMIVAAICLLFTAALFYFLLVAAAAAFIGLILRVIKNVFQQALALKEENDYTI